MGVFLMSSRVPGYLMYSRNFDRMRALRDAQLIGIWQVLGHVNTNIESEHAYIAYTHAYRLTCSQFVSASI